MTKWLAIIILTIAAQQSLGAQLAFDKPWFCHDLDCPEFTVTDRTDSYELREYAAARWASTVIEDHSYGKAVRMGFERLFKYISGKNEDDEKIAMTAPVRVLIHPSQGPYCKSNFTVSFFVPPKYQDSPPPPKAKNVFIEHTPCFRAYVTSYGGWQTEEKFTSKASKLFSKLTEQGIKLNDNEYYAVGYDSPFRLMNRHNEVWLIAEDAQSDLLQSV